jgi:acetylornithine deacetylase/succinyl-diaminopimelate desuccinylase-like protein
MKKITIACAFAALLCAAARPPKRPRRRSAQGSTRDLPEGHLVPHLRRSRPGAGDGASSRRALPGRGFKEEDIHILPVGETASLVVRYRGKRPRRQADPPARPHGRRDREAEEWQRDPFTLIEENGYFFGRGTLDNKQGVTTLTTTFLRLKREGFVPTRDLIIAFSGDEETGMTTATDLANKNRALIDAEYALNSDDGGGQLDEKTGKPQYLSFVGAEKISATYELTVRNPGGHSSAPRADNAIYELADALKAVQAYRFPVKSNDWTLGSFKATGPVTPGPLGEAMTRFAANPQDESAAAEIAKVPTEIGKTRTTCVATMLRGGHASNALPQTATATVSCRIFPDTSDRRRQEYAGASRREECASELLGSTPPAGASPLRKDVLAALTKAAHAQYPGIPVVPAWCRGRPMARSIVRRASPRTASPVRSSRRATASATA